MTKKELVAGAVKLGKTVATEFQKSESLQRQVFGSYTDGKPRNLTDAITGEIHSPKERQKMEMRLLESEKKKKKKKKKGEKYAKINL